MLIFQHIIHFPNQLFHKILFLDFSYNLSLTEDQTFSASGDSIIEIAKELKRRNAANVYVAVTFGLFTEGVEVFNQCYEEGLIKRFFSTNLTYIPDSVKNAEWFVEVDLSRLIATLIDRLNHDESISSLLTATEKIKALLKQI